MLPKSGVTFSIEEVFEIAKKIEQNGYEFYSKAAQACPEHREFLQKMADEEKGHEKTFDRFAEKLIADQDRYLANTHAQEALKYIEAIADRSVFLNDENSEEIFSNFHDADQVFEEALDREGKAILFFLGIKEMMLDEESKKAVEMLIQEEMTHIAWIKENRPK